MLEQNEECVSAELRPERKMDIIQKRVEEANYNIQDIGDIISNIKLRLMGNVPEPACDNEKVASGLDGHIPTLDRNIDKIYAHIDSIRYDLSQIQEYI